MSNWKIISRENLEVEKWNDCVKSSINENIYGYTWYLDCVAPKWVALVYLDYQQVLPLPVKQKLSVNYIFQPEFYQRSSIYHKSDPLEIGALKELIISKYLKIDFTCDVNLFDSKKELNNVFLNFSNKELKVSKNTIRNIKKALNSGLTYTGGSSNDISESCNLFISTTNFNLGNSYKKSFLQLCQTLESNGALEIRKVDLNGEVLGYAVYARSRKRIVLLQLAISQHGKKIGASHLLIQESINEFSDKVDTFDFEGSQNHGIARFYLSFGGEIEKYYHFQRNLKQGVLSKLVKV